MGGRMLECRDLRRSFGDLVAVDGGWLPHRLWRDLWAARAEQRGETTTISMIAGLLERDGGDVLVGGEPMTTHSTHTKGALG